MKDKTQQCCEKCLNGSAIPDPWCGDKNCPCHKTQQCCEQCSRKTKVGLTRCFKSSCPCHTGLDGWGEKLEELINELRHKPFTDSVHIHAYVRRLITQVKEEGKEMGYELRDQEYAITLTGVIKKVKEERDNEVRGVIERLYEDTMLGDGFIGAGEREWQKIKEFLPIFKEQLLSLLTHLNKGV